MTKAIEKNSHTEYYCNHEIGFCNYNCQFFKGREKIFNQGDKIKFIELKIDEHYNWRIASGVKHREIKKFKSAINFGTSVITPRI